MLPAGMTLVSMTGQTRAGWACAGATCTSGVAVASGAAMSPLTVTVNVAANAPSQLTNQAIVSGGGSASASATDPTSIGPMQTITFNPLNEVTFGVAPFTVSATATSGLPVSFSSSTNAVCRVSGATVSIVAGGVCTIAASQAGNASYGAAAVVSQSFLVDPANQTIAFPQVPNLPYVLSEAFVPQVSASSNEIVYLSTSNTKVCSTDGVSTVYLNGPGVCTLTANALGSLTYNSASATQSFTVVPSQPPAITGVVNAAGGGQATPSVVSPGSYVAIYGTGLGSGENPSAVSTPLPYTLNETSVTLCGLKMPLLYAGTTQINALVPLGLTPNPSCPLVVTSANVQSAPVQLMVTELQPAIYTVNEAGSGPGIVAEAATGQLNSASVPAHVSDYLVVYCTGLGLSQGPAGQAGPADGTVTGLTPLYRTTATVTATIGGVNAPVTFSGLTPTFVALYQVNVQVPAGVAAGSAVPLVITASDSQTGATAQSNSVTIAVQ